MPTAFRGKKLFEIPNGHPLPPDARAASRGRAVLWSRKRGFAERNIARVARTTHFRPSAVRNRSVMCNFRLKGWNGIGCSRVMHRSGIPLGCIIVLGRPYFTRQAATLLKFAKLTSNPALAASLVERAADLKAQIDSDKRPDAGIAPPDVEIETS